MTGKQKSSVGKKTLEEKISILEAENERLNQIAVFFKALMDNIPDTIYFKDPDSRFVQINKMMANVLGLDSPEEAIGKTDFDFFTKEHASDAYNDEQEILATGISLINKEEDVIGPNNRRRWITSTKVPFRNSDGDISGLVGISRNITEIHEAQEEIKTYAEKLRISNVTKDKFFSIIAHDLKNPFNTILGFTGVLLNEFPDLEDEVKDLIQRMDKASHYAYGLLENLLHWARSQTGSINFSPVSVDLHQIISENIEGLSGTAAKKNIVLKRVSLPGSFAEVDINMINMVLRNLIMNAIKFSNNDSEILVKLESRKDNWEIKVIDSGIGIPQRNIRKLFRIDLHISTLGTGNEKGTGLGLILCNEFITAHKGKIQINSAQDKGTTVTVILPFKQNKKS